MPRKPSGKAKKHGGRGWIWVLTLTEQHIDELRSRLAAIGPQWNEWEYKLHAGNIIIYTPVIPWHPKTRKPDPSLRYMAKQLRIVSTTPGPFQLEYWRHTEQWWPLFCKGDVKEIVDYIAADQRGFCEPPEVSRAD